MSSLTQKTTSVNVEFLYPADGVYFNDAIGEWEVIIDGDPVAWSETQSQAWRSYHEMLEVDRRHLERNPENGILYSNADDEVSVWKSCPSCGGIIDAGEVCNCPDDYGLEARG